eukprot:NODE_163_length_16507_cov_1.031814.p3 type:complete len:335 gc:universal NODE_163_length_16507_cov_1.031814:4189-5193(+)
MTLARDIIKNGSNLISKSSVRLNASDIEYLKTSYLRFNSLMKTKFQIDPIIKNDTTGAVCELVGKNSENAQKFMHRLLKVENVDLSKYPLPVELQDWTAYSILQNNNVEYDRSKSSIKGRVKQDISDSINFVKLIYQWSKIQHFDVLRKCGHSAVPFYPSFDPTDFNRGANNYTELFDNYLIPTGYAGFRLFPHNISAPYIVSSMANRQFTGTPSTNFKLYVEKGFANVLHLDMKLYDWKVETGYAIHLQKTESSDLILDSVELEGPSQLRKLSNLTIFQPMETLEDYSDADAAIKAYFYISNNNYDFRVTLFESKRQCPVDLMEYLSSVDFVN